MYTITIWVQGQGWEVSDTAKTLTSAIRSARLLMKAYGTTKTSCSIEDDKGQTVALWRLFEWQWKPVNPE